ncbi:omptin family outer membrane protease [Pseudomonas sp. Pseusp122]|uniref:omptin family outer membrane protease n=1 Tax=unclassified Pseudomonas TaxID=196821 RepID=UPI0039A6D0D4
MNVRKTLLLLGLVAVTPQVWADAQVSREQLFQVGDLELSVGMGLLSGKAEEKAYDTDDGKKISQLDWDIKQVTTLHFGLAYHPLDWLSLNAGGWTRVAGGSSHMRDYDWLDDEQDDWSDYSTHPDTRLTKAWQAEISATAWAIKRNNLALGVMAGYQRNQLGWESKGGRYTYSSEGDYRDQQGRFLDDVKVITYQQNYDTPYVGLVGLYNWQDWTLDSRFKYSQWVKARDYDQHHLRDLTFTGNHGNSGRMQSLALGLTWRVDPQMSLRAGFDYQVYAEAKGSVLARHVPSGETHRFGGKAGSQASRTLLSSVALTYQF